jgi:hypothetical protein
VFNKNIHFEGVQFQGESNFHLVIFIEVTFRRVIFKGEAKFLWAEFKEGSDFSEVEFQLEADFEGVVFKIDIGFTKVEFCGMVSFHDATFQGEVSFSNVVFHKEAKFSFLTFKEKVKSNSCLKLSGATFKESFYLDFFEGNNKEACVLLNSAKFLSYCQFDIRNLATIPNFDDASIPNPHDLDLKDREELRDKKELLGNKENKESSFRFLKRYYKEKLDFEKSHFYFVLEIERKKENLKWWKKIPYCLYEITSNYGKSISLPAIWLAFSCFIFWNFFLTFNHYQSYDCQLLNILGSIDFWKNSCTEPNNFSPFWDSLSRTIYPALFKGEILKHYSTVLLALQTIINTALWFLLLLGVKNKFQIK